MEISELIKRAHSNAKAKGFWDKPREFGTTIALLHSELSEALEADRIGDAPGMIEEIADVAIRLGDMCGYYNIPLEEAILKKMEKNEKRPYLHNKSY
jgi:NTP pyrophosphatase (non-canonical NTP hydrolase)